MILNDAAASKPTHDDAQVAFEAVERSLDVANRFRKHCQRADMNLQEQSIQILMNELVAECKNAHPELAIQYISSLPPGMMVSADARALADVITELVANSIHFHPEQRPQICINSSVSELQPDRGRVLILYTDNGPGVPQQHKDRIFDPFFATRASGTGIGLADVKDVITRHSGSILESGPPGGGARFEIRIPIVR
jgi:signal transduction histidine kinase